MHSEKTVEFIRVVNGNEKYWKMGIKLIKKLRKLIFIYFCIWKSNSRSKEPVFFLHIGKNAGTSLKKMIEEIESERYEFYLLTHAYRFKDIPRGRRVIFAIREPWERIESSYKSRHRQGQPTYLVPWTKAEQKFFHRYPSFENVIDAIGAMPSVLRADLMALQHLRQGYAHYLETTHYLLDRQADIFFVFNRRNLPDDFMAFLADATNTNSKTPALRELHVSDRAGKENEVKRKMLSKFTRDEFQSETSIYNAALQIWERKRCLR